MAAYIAGMQGRQFCKKLYPIFSTLPLPGITNSRRGNYYIVLPNVPFDTRETNPLMRTEIIPNFKELTRNNCVNAVAKLCFEYDLGITKLEEGLKDGSVEKTFSNLIEAIDKLSVPLEFAWFTLHTLSYVNTSLDLSTAVSKLIPFVQKAKGSRCSLPIYHALKEINADRKNLSPVQQHVLDKNLFELQIAGISLSKDKKEMFDTTLRKLLSQKDIFRNNVNISTSKFKHEFSDTSLFENLPIELKTYMAKDKSRPNQGPWVLTLHKPVYDLFMEHCSDRMHRWNAWRANVARASDGSQSANSVVIEEIRSSRKVLADLLGFSSFAEYSMQTKMAGSIGNVQEMLKTLHVHSKPIIEEELLKLQDFALQNDFNGQLELWDIPYWRRIYKKEALNLDDFEINQYFQLDSVMNGLFELCSKFFGISIKAKESGSRFWSEDVRYYEVFNEKDQFIGSFCFDPYSRFGQKVPHDFFMPLRNRCAAVNVHPVSCLVYNLHRPILGQSTHLKFDDVLSLYEKMGYVIQHIVSEVPYNDCAGMNIMEMDMMPATPKLFRHMLLHYETCALLTKNSKTGESIPRELHQRIVKGHLHMAAYDLTKEVYLSTLDLELHTKKDVMWNIVKSQWSKFIPFTLDKVDFHPCTFSEIFSENLGSSYYILKWAEMIAADMFGAFLEVGLNNEAEVKNVGRRFRDTILTVGGGCPATESFRRFRGRDPSIEALLASYGIQKGKPSSHLD